MRSVRAIVTLDIATTFDDDESTVETLLFSLLEDLNDTDLYTVYDIKGRVKAILSDANNTEKTSCAP